MSNIDKTNSLSEILSSKYFPFLLCLFLMFLHFISAYPGGMSSDTFDQYSQSISGNYYSHHPPLMSMLWSVLHYIYQGPQTMLFIHLALLWGGVLLLFYANPQNKYKYLYFVIPLLSNILSQSATIWKDVAFSLGSFFIFATCVFYTYHKKPAPLLIIIGLLLLCFYIASVKFQAKYIAPILIFFIISIYLNINVVLRLIITTVISILIIFANESIINRYSINTHSEQLRQLFDVAGVSFTIDNDDLIPQYIKDNDALYSFEKLKKYYSCELVNPLVFHDNRIYDSTLDPANLQQMEAAYIQAYSKHPIIFLKNRAKIFNVLMNRGKECEYAFIAENDAQQNNFPLQQNYFKQLVTKYLKLYPNIMAINLVSFILIFVYLTHIIAHRRSRATEITILNYVVVLSLTFSLVIFFATMAADYRYYYVVRVLTLFSLPIYFKSITNNRRL